MFPTDPIQVQVQAQNLHWPYPSLNHHLYHLPTTAAAVVATPTAPATVAAVFPATAATTSIVVAALSTATVAATGSRFIASLEINSVKSCLYVSMRQCYLIKIIIKLTNNKVKKKKYCTIYYYGYNTLLL